MKTTSEKNLTFDCETRYWSEEVKGGWDNIADFGLTVCTVRDWDGFYRSYLDPSISEFIELESAEYLTIEQLTDLFDEADRLISFNGDNFDFEVLRGFGFEVGKWRQKSFDILAKFKASAGHRISLDTLSCQLLGETKLLDGRLAVGYWRVAEKLLDTNTLHELVAKDLFTRVLEYCIDDVSKTWQIYQLIYENDGQLTYIDNRNQKITIDIY